VAALALSQGSGRLEGVAKDAQGLVLPGVTVTLTGAAVMGQRLATTGVDGSYRFLALPPGSYDLLFELAGFQTFDRQGVIVTTGDTFAIDVTLPLAAVAEAITVTGGSPLVDVKATGVGATFGAAVLEDVPSATDMWAVLQQTPGIRMGGFDVGGSHKSLQTEYDSFGVRYQNRIVNEGVNSTEGTGYAGGYYDYYAIEEFRVSAQGADVEMSSPGANVVSVFKSGGNELSSLMDFDFETSGMVSDNIDQALIERAGTSAPVRQFHELHLDLGGPVVKDRVWFYGAYNYFKIDQVISGQPEDIATNVGLFHEITGKLNWKISEKDQFIGFSHWSNKQAPYRGLSSTRPAESILPQNGWTWLHKAEWQRVWSERLFSDILLGHFGYGYPFAPVVDPATNPPRIDLSTGKQRGAGWPSTKAGIWKPQSTGQLNYYLPQAAGSHDIKLGWDWQIDSFQASANLDSGAIRYRDRSGLGPCNPCAAGQLGKVDEIMFYNRPTSSDDRNTHWDFYAQDIWTPTDRLTLTVGARFGRQDAHYMGATQTPLLSEFFDPVTIESRTVKTWNKVAPRLGATFDLMGRGKTVLKGYYGRYYANASTMSYYVNPTATSSQTYKFLDPNGNGIYDGQQELGAFVSGSGGATGAVVDPDMKLAYVDEFSFSLEHELVADTSLRFSYVRKQTRNNWENPGTPYAINVAQAPERLTRNVSVPCVDCPIGFEGTTLDLRTLPDGVENYDPVVTNALGDTDGNYDTLELAFQRRFTKDFFINANADYQRRSEMRAPIADRSPPVTDPIGASWDPGFNRDVGLRQDTTYWSFKSAARYVAPRGIGLAATLRVQSGFPWAPIYSENLPNVGTVSFFLEDIRNSRSDTVAIVDFRADEEFTLRDRYRLMVMADLYNLLNANPETNFILLTGSDFRNVIAWLPGRTLKLGVRLQF
jgi:outer membrane receptor protein involved in Fe transport